MVGNIEDQVGSCYQHCLHHATTSAPRCCAAASVTAPVMKLAIMVVPVIDGHSQKAFWIPSMAIGKFIFPHWSSYMWMRACNADTGRLVIR